ncbi:NADH-ubiquinone oxidoreductase chain 5-like 6, partial [Homarus americanus]
YQPERIQAGVYTLFYTLFASLPLLVSVLRFYRLGVSVRILGGVIVRFMCLRQVDSKSLIAYSSVAHIGLVLRGLVVFAVVIMVGHGLCSSGFFCLANIVYERLGSRRLLKETKDLIASYTYLVLPCVLSIGALIVRPNIIRILLGWDGLGLVSYALVIFYQNEKSANAGILTVVSNRVGDVAILLRISLIFIAGVLSCLSSYNKKSTNSFFCLASSCYGSSYSSVCFSPFFYSGYGSFNGVRSSICFINHFLSNNIIAGLGANFEYDLKKIIALSTLSQLGVILRILALGFADLAFFHLLAHALFKALLFICAGVVIHAVKEYQDIRCMGRLVFRIPLTRTCINLANLALCGIPFLAGFYSKDLILEVAFIRNINLLAFILYALATGLTVCYRFRLVYYSLTGLFNLRRISQVNDKSVVITRSMIRLRIGGVTGGAFLSWVIFPESYIICLTFTFKVLALALRVLGALIGYLLNIISVNYRLHNVVFIGSMWFIPFLSTFNLNHARLKTAGACMKVGDYGWSEHFGGQGLYSNVMHQSGCLQVSQSRGVRIYIKRFLF